MDIGSIADTPLTFWQVIAVLFTWLGGVLFNFINRVSREGMDWKEYWTHNPLKVLSSLFVSLGICISMMVSGNTDHLTYFTVSFMAENLMNVPRKEKQNAEESK